MGYLVVLVHLVDLVCLVYLVCSVGSVHLEPVCLHDLQKLGGNRIARIRTNNSIYPAPRTKCCLTDILPFVRPVSHFHR